MITRQTVGIPQQRGPSETPEELLAKLPAVHPSMVPAYLAEGTLTVLLEIRDLLRSLCSGES